MLQGRGARRTAGIVLGAAATLVAAALALRLAPCPDPLEGVAFSRVLLSREGQLLRLGLTDDHKYRIRTRLEDLPPEAVRSIIRYEDRWFWYHPGVNPLAMLRAAWTMARGGRVMGGSTITMQVARLMGRYRTGSLADKLRQVLLALRLEAHWSKAQILNAYFNLAPYGGNVEGIGAAARVYFHKEAAALLPSESLALMLVPQNPQVRRPSQRNAHFLEAARRLTRQWLGEDEYAPLRVFSPAQLPHAAPHLAAELLRTVPPGTVTRTSISMPLQALLEKQLRLFAARGTRYGLTNAAAMLVRWTDRQVLALAGSADFANRAIEGEVDGTLARRSPGSTLKPFIYALALEQGLIHPHTLLSDLPRSFSGYDPENFDGAFRGPLPADEALRASRNVPAIALAARLRNPRFFEFLRKAGVAFAKSEEHYGLSLVLGGAEVSMRELASLYCMLADSGVLQPLALTEGSESPAQRQQLLTPEAAFVALSMLEGSGPESAVTGRAGLRIPLLAKTGTSNGFRDAWTAGVFGPYVLVVWAGNFDNTPNPLLVGAQTALPLFRSIAREVTAVQRPANPLAAAPARLNLERIPVCTSTGDLDTTLCQDTTDIWFIPGVSPVRPTGILRRILIDTETGLRDCAEREGRTREEVWEFWPTELEQQFQRAGIRKPHPPAFRPECRQQDEDSADGPQIVLPKPGLVYHVGPASPGIALQAHAKTGVQAIYWFLGSQVIAQTRPGETALVRLPAGSHRIRAVDTSGAASVRRVLVQEMGSGSAPAASQ